MKLSEEIGDIVGKILVLRQEAVKQTLAVYETEVEQIILTKSTERQRIERALDQLLEVAFDDKVLVLFKRLCRYYYFINTEAAVYYVQSYREMWDDAFEEARIEDSNHDGADGSAPMSAPVGIPISGPIAMNREQVSEKGNHA